MSKRKQKKKEDRWAILYKLNPCCCIGVLALLTFGFFAFGWALFGTIQTDTDTGIPDSWVPPAWMVPPPEDNGSYYQLGLEFPVRCEDIDVLMVVMLYQSGGVGWIENINLAPIGLAVSANDYKPDDMFFLDMFYGDEVYNISMSGVVTVGEAIQMTVYINNVAIDEVVDVTWIADGSGVRWDY